MAIYKEEYLIELFGKKKKEELAKENKPSISKEELAKLKEATKDIAKKFAKECNGSLKSQLIKEFKEKLKSYKWEDEDYKFPPKIEMKIFEEDENEISFEYYEDAEQCENIILGDILFDRMNKMLKEDERMDSKHYTTHDADGDEGLFIIQFK